MADLLFVSRTDRCTSQECSSLLVSAKRVIDGEYDAISPYDLQEKQKRGFSEKAAGRNMKVLQKVLGYAALQLLCQRREHIVDTCEHERKHLSHMPDDDLQAG